MLSLQEILQKNKQKRYEEEWLIRIHHELMLSYGWIPFEEFKKLPIPTLINLINCLTEDNKKREEMNKEIQKKYRGKR